MPINKLNNKSNNDDNSASAITEAMFHKKVDTVDLISNIENKKETNSESPTCCPLTTTSSPIKDRVTSNGLFKHKKYPDPSSNNNDSNKFINIPAGVDKKKTFRRSYNCGPCKKHKIKCDMKIPCGNCEKYNRRSKCLKEPPTPPTFEQSLKRQKRKRRYLEKKAMQRLKENEVKYQHLTVYPSGNPQLSHMRYSLPLPYLSTINSTYGDNHFIQRTGNFNNRLPNSLHIRDPKNYSSAISPNFYQWGESTVINDLSNHVDSTKFPSELHIQNVNTSIYHQLPQQKYISRHTAYPPRPMYPNNLETDMFSKNYMKHIPLQEPTKVISQYNGYNQQKHSLLYSQQPIPIPLPQLSHFAKQQSISEIPMHNSMWISHHSLKNIYGIDAMDKGRLNNSVYIHPSDCKHTHTDNK